MKVLIVANYAKEHINKFHLSTIKRFKELGWMVDVACRVDAQIPYCDNVFDIPLRRNPYRFETIRAIRQLKKIIASGKYDVIHCHTYAGKLVGILAAYPHRKNGLKVIYTSHGFQYYKGASILSWLLFLPIDKWLVSKTDLLVTINQEDYDTAVKHRFRVKNIVRCCGAGVKLERFDAEGKQADSSVRQRLFIPEEAIILIYVAELNKNKNQKMLIRVFEKLQGQIPNLYMLFVGPDHSGGHIPQYINKKGLNERIKCLGWRGDVPALIRASNIAVASSIREGFGVNILEYMYCGIPVVAVNNRGHKEIIKDGINGILVPVNDDEKMAQAILNLYNNETAITKMTFEAMKTVEEFKDEVIVNKILEIYQGFMPYNANRKEEDNK